MKKYTIFLHKNLNIYLKIAFLRDKNHNNQWKGQQKCCGQHHCGSVHRKAESIRALHTSLGSHISAKLSSWDAGGAHNCYVSCLCFLLLFVRSVSPAMWSAHAAFNSCNKCYFSLYRAYFICLSECPESGDRCHLDLRSDTKKKIINKLKK